jgi:signal transduction histidine kinase/diacylglycerol kinase family enzyme/DNA-binding response OmpR family regulator
MTVEKTPLMSRFVIFSVLLFLIIVIGGSVTYFFSMRQIIRGNKGNELIRLLEIERINMEVFVTSEIALVLKMADSPLIKRYFANPKDRELERAAFEEIASYRRAFSDFTTFWVNDIDRIFYFDDNEPYWVDAEDPANYWFNMTLYETEVYNFNINYNPDLQQIRLWLNAPVFDSDRKPIGMLGTGMELSRFIDTIFKDIPPKVEIYFFNGRGEIYGARDIKLVEEKRQIEDIMPGKNAGFFEKARNLSPGEIQTFNVPKGKIAVGSLPVLEWYSAAFIPDSIEDYKNTMTVLFIVVLILISLIFLVFNLFISRFLKSLRGTMESLEYAKNEAEEANKSKSNFLTTISHEIRTPMNAIIGIAQIQLQKQAQRSDLPKEYASSMEKIYSSGNILLGIINDILDMSKIETGKLELNPSEYDVPSLINDAVQLNIVRIGSKHIDFKLDLDENLPSRLYGDELRLKQILNNLLSNAIKYTEKGFVKLSVNHFILGEDIMLRFVVEDTGQGMRGEDKKRLFSQYLRFNAAANRSTEGTGLGLNITKKLVEMMDGVIGVQSEFGKGSVFTVTIKQKAVECPVVGAELAQRLRNFTFVADRQTVKLQVARESMPYGSVLVVDDVETNLYVAEGLLSPYDLKIETAINGFVTLDKVKNGKTYDIIFMDHMMPDMDGIETTEKLRELGYRGVIVALTANALVGNEELFAQHGFDGFISKPIDVQRLDAVLNQFIRDRHLQKIKESPAESAAEIPQMEAADAMDDIEEIAELDPVSPQISFSGNGETSSQVRHLFIINPAARRIKGKIKPVKDKISAFFAKHPGIKHDIYISQWSRDSVMFIQDYIAGINDETLRIHAIGGTGTFFEIVNSVVGLPNVEIASHPYGKANSFLRYFGIKNEKLFLPLESQVFDKTIPMDIIRCGNNYGICYGMSGIEAYANAVGDKWIEKGMPADISYMIAGMIMILSGKTGQNYFMEIDDHRIKGDFASVMVANAPCYGVNMHPAIDAHPDDGLLDVYAFKNASRMKLLSCVPSYTHGNYRNMLDLVSHYRAKKIKLSSDEVMCMSIDGEHFYGTSIEYELLPKAVRFVCPDGIDLKKLPLIYNRPREGLRSE